MTYDLDFYCQALFCFWNYGHVLVSLHRMLLYSNSPKVFFCVPLLTQMYPLFWLYTFVHTMLVGWSLQLSDNIGLLLPQVVAVLQWVAAGLWHIYNGIGVRGTAASFVSWVSCSVIPFFYLTYNEQINTLDPWMLHPFHLEYHIPALPFSTSMNKSFWYMNAVSFLSWVPYSSDSFFYLKYNGQILWIHDVLFHGHMQFELCDWLLDFRKKHLGFLCECESKENQSSCSERVLVRNQSVGAMCRMSLQVHIATKWSQTGVHWHLLWEGNLKRVSIIHFLFSLCGGRVSGSSATSPFTNERLMISFVLLSAFLVGAKVELSLPLFCMVSFFACF